MGNSVWKDKAKIWQRKEILKRKQQPQSFKKTEEQKRTPHTTFQSFFSYV